MTTGVSYRRQLDCAISAALQAGALLRQEFHRPGGPRGTRDHAEIDPIAEQAIHQTLSAPFPDYGYLGEELGPTRNPQDAQHHLWLVDPNDGTSAFMKGFRGPAVSIALLRDGEPVLGVVYSYCAPDSRGDLFTWAEGADGLKRNGREVSRHWPSAASPNCTVLLSQGAEKYVIGNATLFQPMRFRAIPSIAYRLALVAAGEADLAVSLTKPVGWDYAGGHALLRAAGGDLFDDALNPVHYDRHGRSHCRGRCFGGSASLVREIGPRPWKQIFRNSPRGDSGQSLCWPVKGQTVANPELLARAQGCLLGQLAGDSLGSSVESYPAAIIRRLFPDGLRLLIDGGTIAGQPTDDSEMALALARSIVGEGAYRKESAARAYAQWYHSGPFSIGNTIRAALSDTSSGPNPESQANGALMRVSPIGILGASAAGLVEGWAREDAEITHPNRVCQDANALFAGALAFAISSGENAGAVYEYAIRRAEQIGVDPSLAQVLRSAKDGPPEDYSRLAGWVLNAFQNAFYQLLHAGNLEEGVTDTVMRGGDTDTNAAIAGALLGAVWGRDAIPHQWLDRILTCRPIPGLPNVRHPRPETYWPVDALHLGESLLLAGARHGSPTPHAPLI
jgi:ADP-ribosyl-[dinitrogen reductase] hydrolase